MLVSVWHGERDGQRQIGAERDGWTGREKKKTAGPFLIKRRKSFSSLSLTKMMMVREGKKNRMDASVSATGCALL